MRQLEQIPVLQRCREPRRGSVTSVRERESKESGTMPGGMPARLAGANGPAILCPGSSALPTIGGIRCCAPFSIAGSSRPGRRSRARAGAAWSPDEGATWTTLPGVHDYWAVAFAGHKAGWLVGTEGRILKVSF
jgi:hypothetical protein